MRALRCTAAAVVTGLAVSLVLAGCSAGGPGTVPSAPAGSQAFTPYRPAAPAAKAGKGVYVVTGTPSGQYVINEYPLNDTNNSAPLCSINAGTSIFPGDLAADKQGNLWVPTIATVKNAEGNVAGALNYSHFTINTGLEDSIFKY